MSKKPTKKPEKRFIGVEILKSVYESLYREAYKQHCSVSEIVRRKLKP